MIAMSKTKKKPNGKGFISTQRSIVSKPKAVLGLN